MRTLLAFLLACLTPFVIASLGGLTYWVVTVAGYLQSKDASSGGNELALSLGLFLLGAVQPVAVVILPCVLAGALFVGVLRIWRLVSMIAYVGSGFVVSIGVMVYAYLTGVIPNLHFGVGDVLRLQYTLTFVCILVAGPLSAFVFWRVSRPDRLNVER